MRTRMIAAGCGSLRCLQLNGPLGRVLMGRLPRVARASRSHHCSTKNMDRAWPPEVTLVEVGPRDGLQNEPSTISTDVKVMSRSCVHLASESRNSCGSDRRCGRAAFERYLLKVFISTPPKKNHASSKLAVGEQCTYSVASSFTYDGRKL